MADTVKVIGGGLAGCEAALQLARAGVQVDLFEMRPTRTTPAHKSGGLAELVCSNSFKGLSTTSAHGLFKEELIRMGSLLIPMAMKSRVAAGESLAVDREKFSAQVEQAIAAHPNITLHRENVTALNPEEWTLVATGPLTSEELCTPLFELLGTQRLAFFDSIAPVVEKDSLDFNHAYFKNRWEKGDTSDFINCPLSKDEYLDFVNGLVNADQVEAKPFEKGELFEGCLPIEEMARRGPETLRYGPLRPVGLMHPETGVKPYAVLQLRTENRFNTLYNLVGCQTRLKWGTQKQVLSLIPALREANYVRMGAMHRNTFINSPEVLDNNLRLKGTRIHFAGQITGAEGYTEAVGTGLFASTVMFAHLHNRSFEWPEATCLGALTRHLTHPNPNFQPMNLNFGLFPETPGIRKAERKQAIADRCLETLRTMRLPWTQSKSISHTS